MFSWNIWLFKQDKQSGTEGVYIYIYIEREREREREREVPGYKCGLKMSRVDWFELSLGPVHWTWSDGNTCPKVDTCHLFNESKINWPKSNPIGFESNQV